MLAMAIAPPRPASAPARTSPRPLRMSARAAVRSRSIFIQKPRHNRKGRKIALPPRRSRVGGCYFRLVIAVRSAESLAIPAEPHQFEPTPDGLIGVTLVV